MKNACSGHKSHKYADLAKKNVSDIMDWSRYSPVIFHRFYRIGCMHSCSHCCQVPVPGTKRMIIKSDVIKTHSKRIKSQYVGYNAVERPFSGLGLVYELMSKNHQL